MKISDELIINNILFNKYNTLGKLCYHAQKLKLLDNVLKSAIDSRLANHCRIGSIDNNCLTIETSRSEYLTQLKFNTIDLLTALRKLPAFSQIITIKYKVCPDFNNSNNNNNTTVTRLLESNKSLKNLSDINKDKLLSEIEKISDAKLREALLKLLR